jgi:hypothetical protein
MRFEGGCIARSGDAGLIGAGGRSPAGGCMPGGGRLRSSSPRSAPAGAIILFCAGGAAPNGDAGWGAPGPPRPPDGSPGPTFLLSSGRLSSCPSPRGPLGGRRTGAASGASCCATINDGSGISVGEPASAVETIAAGSAALERRNVTAFMIPSLRQVNNVQPTRPRAVPVAERRAALAVVLPPCRYGRSRRCWLGYGHSRIGAFSR